MVAHTPLRDNKEAPTSSPFINFLRRVDDRRRWRLGIDAFILASEDVTSPAELHGLLLAHVAQQQARAALTGDQALALELLDVTEALLKHRRAALAFCSAVLDRVEARVAGADEPTEWVPS